MPHIHTEPGQHDTTASAYIVRLDFDEPQLMLHKHRLLGKYLQFGGHIELHENPWQAITHEIEEEAGYEIGQLQILQPLRRLQILTGVVLHPYPVAHITHGFGAAMDHLHTDVSYGFIANEPPNKRPNKHESQEIVCLTRSELSSLGSDKIYKNVKETAIFVLEECLKNWEPVDTALYS